MVTVHDHVIPANLEAMHKLRKLHNSSNTRFPEPASPAPQKRNSASSEPSTAINVRSRTMAYASSSTSDPLSIAWDVRPRSSTEQYWAARALTAETLLSARMAHHQEIRTLTYSEEAKRYVSSFHRVKSWSLTRADGGMLRGKWRS